jgi:hypothetical protein
MVGLPPSDAVLVREACAADPRIEQVLWEASSRGFRAYEEAGYNSDRVYVEMKNRIATLVGAHRMDPGPRFLTDERTFAAIIKSLASRLRC